jgi:HEAT repeat protein
MKLTNQLISILLLVLLSTFVTYSQDTVEVIERITESDIDKNYIEGVKSDNLGLRVSASYYLGERKSSRGVIPLMYVLRNDDSAEARIMAALSLFKIGDERGIFAIQKAIEFDENEQVRKMCEIFYQMHLSEKMK